ncbi:MAG: NAD(P)H-hydrate epimerase [Chloroflexi bacterium]|nr:NAD(P)H-hydrate epimerase [Chloroflexota bacterium]
MAQMAEVDRLMIEEYGILLIQMMENAGRSLAELARRMLGGQLRDRHVVVLCGAGNNGGGGMVAARHLHNRGAAVHVVGAGISPAARLKEIPAHQWRILQTIGLIAEGDPGLARADLILDALIGYGLTGDPRGVVAEWVERANAAGCPILALDAPSGLDTTTGRPGSPCIRATATLTLALPKTGLLAPEARPFVGDLYLADIGVPPELYRRLGIEIGPLFPDDTIVRVV